MGTETVAPACIGDHNAKDHNVIMNSVVAIFIRKVKQLNNFLCELLD